MKNLDEVRDEKAKINAEKVVGITELAKNTFKDKYTMPKSLYPLVEIQFKRGWNECAKLKDEEWRKVVEPLVEKFKLLIEKYEDDHDVEDYLDDIYFASVKALAEYEKKVGEK